MAVAVLLQAVSLVAAQGALKTIDNPKGSRIVYGQVEGAGSEAAAMGVVLRGMHNQFGDRPNVGKIFRVHGTNSVAAFFVVNKRTQGSGQVAGLVLASTFAPGHIEAALLSDDSARFGSTVNPMLNQLFGVWHPGGEDPFHAPPTASSNAGQGNAGSANSGKAAVLREFSLADHSASVSLPDGWKVTPSSGAGTIIAEGPNGEAVSLGFPFLAMNSADPRVQQTQQWAQQGGGRNTIYAKTLYYPYGADLGKTFVDLTQMWRVQQGLARIPFQITSETPVPAPAGERCARLLGQLDSQDGKGVREVNSVFCEGPLAPRGSFMNLAYHTAVPVPLAPKERATMEAILGSFNVNAAVVQGQARAIAAPAIAAIHEIGKRAAQQAADAHETNDRYNRGVEARWDSQDKRNQAFSNYLLDQTVIRDNELNAHGTVWNQTADRLVHDNPEHYEYVSTPDYWKGVDY